MPTLEGAGKSVDRIYNLECGTSFTPTYFSDFNPPPYEKHTPMASAIGA